MDIQNTYKDLLENMKESNIYMNEPMSNHTSFKIGGKADIFIKIKTIEDLKFVINYCKQKNIFITIIGNGSNLLVKDNGIRGITIQVDFQDIQIKEENNNNNENETLVTVGSGVKLGALSMILQKKSLSGLEFASGIPGTIGGAVRMNAGAYGTEFKEIVESVTYIDNKGDIQTIKNEEAEFSYRYSKFVNTNDIILSTVLKVKKEDEKEIENKMQQYLQSRKEKQPINIPSAGSTFKRGTDFIAAQLIDQAGLKGYNIGGAQVSQKHAGFIVNTGNATAKDVIELTDYVIKTVYEKYGKKLELEIEIVGE